MNNVPKITIDARMIEAMTVNMRATATGGNNSEA